MRATQGHIWSFPLDRGAAIPKDREHFPDAFNIPHRHTSLFPIKVGEQMHYLSFEIGKTGLNYYSCPRVGDPRQLDIERTEKELLEGLLLALPGRVNAQTLFARIQTLPQHLHLQAIDHLAGKHFTGIYLAPGDLKRSLLGMNDSMGYHVQRELSISQMAHELNSLPAEARPKATLAMRKKFPEPWVADAQAVAIKSKMKASSKTPESKSTPERYDFGI
jgi:hypothetical protein